MLGNGMQVVVVPDRRAPVVTHVVWYRIGGADNIAGQSGLAHFLEHLGFQSRRPSSRRASCPTWWRGWAGATMR
jgi:predicted Zn-dependent peptidase